MSPIVRFSQNTPLQFTEKTRYFLMWHPVLVKKLEDLEILFVICGIIIMCLCALCMALGSFALATTDIFITHGMIFQGINLLYIISISWLRQQYCEQRIKNKIYGRCVSLCFLPFIAATFLTIWAYSNYFHHIVLPPFQRMVTLFVTLSSAFWPVSFAFFIHRTLRCIRQLCGR